MNPISALVLAPVKLYRRFISPLMAPRCRYYPSCSSYFVEAVEVHGPLKGPVLGVCRLLRCNPWSKGGVDHVPLHGHWKAPAWVPPSDWVGYQLDD